MSAVRLVPWVVHQAVMYVVGVLLVLAPFLLDVAEGEPLAVFVGAGVVLLATTVLGPPPAGVAHLLPVQVHAGVVYLLGFFLVLSPFIFRFSDEAAAMPTAVFTGLGLVVVALVTAFPRSSQEEEPVEA